MRDEKVKNKKEQNLNNRYSFLPSIFLFSSFVKMSGGGNGGGGGGGGDAQAVILATAGYDHTIRFWEALSGICYRTVQYPDSV